MGLSFFFDTYALIECVQGNPEYLQLVDDTEMLTTSWNLAETHFILLRKYNEEFADRTYDALKEFVVVVDDESIKAASRMRLAMRRRELSYVDCVGYCMAKRREMKFLTGDKQFKNLPNVEFVV
jgi:predicted nucleic acid-binding protein